MTLFVKSCKISKAIMYNKYTDILHKTGKDPSILCDIKPVAIQGNKILANIMANFNNMNMNISLIVNIKNVWYEILPIAVNGFHIKLVQLVVTSLYDYPRKIISIRYVYIELCL